MQKSTTENYSKDVDWSVLAAQFFDKIHFRFRVFY